MFLFVAFISSCGSEENTLSKELDDAIANKKIYEQKKEKEIALLCNLLKMPNISLQQEFDINSQLYESYRKYRLDSAIYYMKRNLEIAHITDNRREMMIATLSLVPLHSFLGQFRESESLLFSIRREDIPCDLMSKYYEALEKFYYHYGAVSNQNSYMQMSTLYQDSMLMVTDTASFRYRIELSYQYIVKNEFEKAFSLLSRLEKETEVDTPHYAEVAYALGRYYFFTKNPLLEKKYYYISAIADVKSAVKENASFLTLALLSNDEGDIDRANLYIQSAVDDAMFSNIQVRSAQMYKFYSIVTSSYQSKVAKTEKKMQIYLWLIGLLSLILVSLFIYVHQQMRKLNKVKEEVSSMNEHLRALSNDLHEKNLQLAESNQIKEQYIAHFFDLCSSYIDKWDIYRQSLNKLALNRQFDELYKKLKTSSVIETELDELYRNFDSIFLSLYPTFISDFNKLLIPEEQVQLKGDETMNRELRIYALLRLGINNSIKIAAFLRCSLSTVYNYRTKIRNRSISREEFEMKVLQIGVSDNNSHL